MNLKKKKKKKITRRRREARMSKCIFFIFIFFFVLCVRMCLKFFRLSFALANVYVYGIQHAIKENSNLSIHFDWRKKSFWSKTMCTVQYTLQNSEIIIKKLTKSQKLLHILVNNRAVSFVVVIEMNQPKSRQ